MKNQLTQLALDIEQSWEKENLSLSSFPEICLKQLTDFNLELTQDEFEDWVATFLLNEQIPKQLNVYNTFGQPPVTIFNNGHFVVDLYFWMYVDTSIHSHSFSGAFKLLFGRSVHETYQISPKAIYAPDIMSTEFKSIKNELIIPGDTKKITSGNEFNHRLIHLDAPTITLCVRTCDDKKSTQWHHFDNGLSVQKRSLEEEVIKKLYYYNYLFMRNRDNGVQFISKNINAWDISTTLNLYEQISIDGMGIDPEAIDCFFEIVTSKYGETEWFKLYQSFYVNIQENFIELEGGSPAGNFMEHAINARYSMGETVTMIEKIQGTSINQSQKDLLEQLL